MKRLVLFVWRAMTGALCLTMLFTLAEWVSQWGM